MLLFYFWVAVIVAVILAVPVTAKMSPSPAGPAEDAESAESAVEMDGLDPSAAQDPAGVADAGFAADDFGAEPLGDDAFADFN